MAGLSSLVTGWWAEVSGESDVSDHRKPTRRELHDSWSPTTHQSAERARCNDGLSPRHAFLLLKCLETWAQLNPQLVPGFSWIASGAPESRA